MHKVFVYGTLKIGHRNNFILGDSQFVGTGFTAKLFEMRTGSFPIVFENAGRVARVSGEVYDVSDETLKRLDSLEGLGHMYRRRKVLVLVDSGCVSCWMYVGIHKFWRDRLPHLAAVEPTGGQFAWGGRSRTLRDILSVDEIAEELEAQARLRSLENDEAGVLSDTAEYLKRQAAELEEAYGKFNEDGSAH